MKKKLFGLSSFLLAIISVFTLSCSTKSTGIQYGTSVNSVDGLTALSIYDPISFSGGQSFTMGLLFKSSKNGRITHIGARLAAGTYTVALWDSSAQAVLKSAVVTVTDSMTYAFADIDDVSIVAGKIYAITVNNKPASLPIRLYWILSVTNTPTNDYPHTIGDITFTSEIEKQTDDPLSLFPPSYAAPDYVIGFPAFKFEPQL